MKFVFLTLGYPKNPQDKNLYTDLMKSIVCLGHSVTVFRQNEKEKGIQYKIVDGVKVVDVYTGAITKTSFVKKGINLLFIKRRFMKAIKKEMKYPFDVLLYSTPPITFAGIIRKLRKKHKCINYLLLKDIFPQNAVDLGLFSKNNPIYWYFRSLEKKLYNNSDLIGCMSPANVTYLQEHNSYIDFRKIHISPNCIIPFMNNSHSDNTEMLKLVYGGNLGKPQGIDFLIECIGVIEDQSNIEFTIVGSGTEYNKICKYISDNNIQKTKLLSFLPNSEYLKLLSSNDMGMVFLDKNFTIPNFPSRILDYFNFGLPIFAITDGISDVNTEICNFGAGIWAKAGDLEDFKDKLKWLLENKSSIAQMRDVAFKLLQTKYNAKIEAEAIIKRCSKG